MGHWLEELQENLPEDTVLHLVGTKADMVAEDPTRRVIAFETCVAYAAENLYPPGATTPAPAAAQAATPGKANNGARARPPPSDQANIASPQSQRSSMGFWGLDLGWDSCHEVSASSGEGVEEVFRVITRRLVEQRAARAEIEAAEARERRADERARRGGARGDWQRNGGPYGGSFRVGIGDKRRSWLGLPQFPSAGDGSGDGAGRRRGPCCGG